MPQRNPPPGQLDIPLVWATELADGAPAPAPTAQAPAAPPERGASAFRLWAGTLVDGAVTVAGAAAAVAVAAVIGDGISAAGCALAALAGLEAVTVAVIGSLWGWRGTPGMLLAGVRFAHPIPFGRVLTMWGVWLLALPLAGIPLAVRVRGASAAERLAGGELSSRSLPSGA